MIDTILLDIDGVSNQFHKHVFDHLGIHYPDDSFYPTECGWDIVSAANRLAGFERFTPNSFWRSITREMWATAPVSEEFDFLLEWSSATVGKGHVHFLSSPTLDADCVAGKLEWIQGRTPSWMHRQYMIGCTKHLCAKPGALLIDDSDNKVTAFREHGGHAILVPRPWNSLHGRDAMVYLADQFGQL